MHHDLSAHWRNVPVLRAHPANPSEMGRGASLSNQFGADFIDGSLPTAQSIVIVQRQLAANKLRLDSPDTLHGGRKNAVYAL